MLVKLTSFAIQLDLFIHKCGTNFVFITLDDEQNSNVSQSILILTIWKENRQPGLLSFQFVTTWKNFSRPQFIYSEKATKFRKISRFDWHYIGQIYGGDFAKLTADAIKRALWFNDLWVQKLMTSWFVLLLVQSSFCERIPFSIPTH